jgi:hypothetical protein
MRLFSRSPQDERVLTQPWHSIARQHPSRRQQIHGRLHPIDCNCRACRRAA